MKPSIFAPASVFALAFLALAGCSFILDFDDVNGLPCDDSDGCDQNHVCLTRTGKCFPRRSVDIGKSCDLGAANPDDLCQQGAICERVNGEGLRCLLECTVSTYATPEAAISIRNQCPTGTTCWQTVRGGGVCSEGICNDIPNNCTPPEQCVRFNGAGVCFTPCQIFETSPPPCAGVQMCHPIGESSITACVNSGTRQLNEPCDDQHMCAQVDTQSRPLVCDKPQGSSEMDIRRCRAICLCPPGSVCNPSRCNTMASCALSRPNVDPATQAGLGLCIE